LIVILMFAALAVGSVTCGALFGLCSFMVRVVEEDLVRGMASGCAVLAVGAYAARTSKQKVAHEPEPPAP